MKKIALLFIVILLVMSCEQPPVEVTVEVDEMSYVYLNWIARSVTYDSNQGCISGGSNLRYITDCTSICHPDSSVSYSMLRLHSFFYEQKSYANAELFEPYAILDAERGHIPGQIESRTVNLREYEYEEMTTQ